MLLNAKYTFLGFIFGIWNSHTSVGNIVGTLLASWYVESNWGLSFIVPGLFIIISGICIFLFLVVHPSDILIDSNEKALNGNDHKVRFFIFNLVLPVGQFMDYLFLNHLNTLSNFS